MFRTVACLIVALCLFCVVSCDGMEVPNHIYQISQASDAAIYEAKATVARLLESTKNREFGVSHKLQTTISATCQTAWTTALTGSTTCLNQYSTLYSGANAGSNSLSASVSTYCAADGCQATLSANLNTVIAQCSADELDALSGGGYAFASLSASFSAPCVQYQGQYCYPKFASAFLNYSSASGTEFTAADLDRLCDPCVSLVLQSLQNAQSAGVSVAISSAFATLCLKDGDQYCFVYLAALGSSPPAGGDTFAWIQQRYCGNRCLRLISSAISALTNVSFPDLYDVICSTKPDGTFCLSLMSAAQPPDNCPAEPNAISTCTPACKSSINSALGTFGCCSGTLLSLIDGTAFGGDAGTSGWTAFIADQCQITVPGPCVSSAKVVGTLAINNIKASYYANNSAEVKSRIAADIAHAAAVQPSAVSIDDVTTSSTGISVSYTITVSQSASQTTAGLNSQIQAGTFDLSSVNGLPPSAKNDPTQPSSVNSQSSTVTTVSAASASIASFVLLAAAILLSFIAGTLF